MRDLKGRTAVVTGAASGIGRALARKLAREGMRVVATDVEPSPLEASAEELRAEGADVLPVVADIADAAAVADLARRAVAEFGNIHVLCNNAGVVHHGPAWDQSLDDWRWVVGVNLWGVVHGLRCFVPGMLAHGEEGHIMITSSAGGLAASSSSSYTASKFAVAGLAEGLAQEMEASTGGRIGVSLLCPGGVRTGIFRSERNRPAQFAETGHLSAPVQEMINRLAAPDRVDQAPPETIAGYVVDAIRSKQYYVLPMQRAFKEQLRAKATDLIKAVDAGPLTWAG